MFLFFMVGGCVNNVHKSQIPLENGCVMNLYFANNIAESVDYAFSCGNIFEAFEIIDKNKIMKMVYLMLNWVKYYFIMVILIKL